MIKRNKDFSESNILQYQFTAYLMTALQWQKDIYLKKQNKECVREIATEPEVLESTLIEVDYDEGFSLLCQLENEKLYKVLTNARERDRQIFFLHVLEELSFSAIAQQMGTTQKAIEHVYYRFLKKLKLLMGGDKDGF